MAFDVFLSHNHHDKLKVRALYKALIKRGITVWLDELNLQPGKPWQDGLEDGINHSRAAVIIVGEDGLGPWEIPEMRACINLSVEEKKPVIPVLLPGAPEKPEIPLFLKAYTWVDLRKGLSKDGLDKLVWGILDNKPDKALEKAGDSYEDLPHPDVYISFSPIDNKNIGGMGWVDNFHKHLEILLAQRLGTEVCIWHSHMEGEKKEELPLIQKQIIEHSTVFLALMSPASTQPGSCIHERKLFHALDKLVANPSSGNDSLRIMGVMLQNFPLEQRPKELKGAEIFNFFDEDDYRLEFSDNLIKKPLRRLVDSIISTRELMEKEAMSGLRDAWQESEVRDALLQAFEDSGLTFEVIEKQIDLVTDLKEIHDILHRIRIEFYKESLYIFQVDNFPHDPDALFELRDVDELLRFFCSDLREVQQRNFELSNSLRWIGELEKAYREFHSGLESQDLQRLKQGLFGIKRVLFKYPTRINADLTRAAQKLQLSRLTDTIRQVASELRHTGMTDGRIDKISAGIEVLTDIDNGLAQLVRKHDSWQIMDDELRRIEESLEVDSTELQTSWVYIQDYAEGLYGKDKNAWPADLRSLGTALEGKEGILDRARIERDFRHFRSYAGQHFDFADQDLKHQCEKARRIAQDVKKVIPLKVDYP